MRDAQGTASIKRFLTAALYSEQIHSRYGVNMPWELVPKPVGNMRSERFKISLLGNHTVKQKIAMLTLAKFFLHEEGIDNAGEIDLYIPLLNPHGNPITHFRDQIPVAGNQLIIKSPYHCAADDYELRRYSPSHPAPF